MRIRKRQVPLPLSSLSPIPLSDLQVQLLQPRTPPPPEKTTTSLTTRPNHQYRTPIGDQSTNDTAALDRAKWLVDGDGVGEEDAQLGGDSSGSAMGEPLITRPGPNSSSHQVGGLDYDGERAFPLKKRKWSFEMEERDTKKKKMRSLKAKVNKKCNGEEDEDYGETVMKERSAKRKGNRGNVLMEGSRCSRVNGRGWRCCQPTLVGYSLCEHHLGKGRLRSIMTVKSRVPKINKRLLQSSSELANLETIDEADDDDDVNDEEKVALIMAGGKKVVKIGVVKARSMSSLLSQVDNKNGGVSSSVTAVETTSYGDKRAADE